MSALRIYARLGLALARLSPRLVLMIVLRTQRSNLLQHLPGMAQTLLFQVRL